jgi:hypothetical protein
VVSEDIYLEEYLKNASFSLWFYLKSMVSWNLNCITLHVSKFGTSYYAAWIKILMKECFILMQVLF